MKPLTTLLTIGTALLVGFGCGDMESGDSLYEQKQKAKEEQESANDYYVQFSPQEATAVVSNIVDVKDYYTRHVSYDFEKRELILSQIENDLEREGKDSFEENHYDRLAICSEAADGILKLLEDDGYGLSKMGLIRLEGISHEIALIQNLETGNYGTGGIHATDFHPTRFSSYEEIFDCFNERLEKKGLPAYDEWRIVK
jgi:hypothetical protein